jgi:hypothetical protein
VRAKTTVLNSVETALSEQLVDGRLFVILSGVKRLDWKETRSGQSRQPELALNQVSPACLKNKVPYQGLQPFSSASYKKLSQKSQIYQVIYIYVHPYYGSKHSRMLFSQI